MNSKSKIRLHLIAILTGVALFGATVNRILLTLGQHSLVSRNCMVMIASYGLFFVLIKAWLSLLQNTPSGLTDVANQSSMIEPSKVARKESVASWLDGIGFFDGTGDVWFIFLFGILILWIVMWVGIEGPIILIDAAFEVSLSLGLIQASKYMVAGDWYGSVFKRTIIPFMLILITSSAIAYTADVSCPGRSRLSEVLHQCWVK